jgi:hypothetical protein
LAYILGSVLLCAGCDRDWGLRSKQCAAETVDIACVERELRKADGVASVLATHGKSKNYLWILCPERGGCQPDVDGVYASWEGDAIIMAGVATGKCDGGLYSVALGSEAFHAEPERFRNRVRDKLEVTRKAIQACATSVSPSPALKSLEECSRAKGCVANR